MTYTVKEIFYTLQGEGANAGRASIFCRFTGCNLWSGREYDRANAMCKFCDTDFSGGEKFPTVDVLADRIESTWPNSFSPDNRFVVFTGGEPLLQLDKKLIDVLHGRKFTLAVETNGTINAPKGIDWICVSPKANAKINQDYGDEIKLVYPQPEAPPEKFDRLKFNNFFLQPMDGPHKEKNTQLAIQYCLKNPKWRLSLQTHKLIGLR
jgi:7-carboxy-7-deazaguanine synthase (Cx14CxxC type)